MFAEIVRIMSGRSGYQRDNQFEEAVEVYLIQ